MWRDICGEAARICQRLAGAVCWRNDFFNPCDRFMANWFVYLLRCADDSLYTGITTDLKRRVAQHNCGARTGAHYTRSRRPVTLVYHECWESRSAASKREHELRTLNKADKEQLAGSAASDQRR